MKNLYKKVLDKITFLYKSYSEEHRASTQPFHLEKVKKLVKDYKYHYNDLLIREPLIEHTGSLPLIATTIYPYLNEPTVDKMTPDIVDLMTPAEITIIRYIEKKLKPFLN